MSISILLPTYEPNPQLLRETIDSILRQTYTEWTLFIHDDASQEDVRAIVAPYLSDARITFVRSESRHGIGGNWNAAFRTANAGAGLTAYAFQDDTWEPTYLAKAVDALSRHPSAGLVAVSHRYRLEHLHPLSHQYQAIESERRALFAKGFQNGKEFLSSWLAQGLHPNIVGEPSFVVWKTEILKGLPWDENMSQCLDVDGWVRALQITDIAFVAEDLGTFVVHDASASSTHLRSWRGIFDRLRILLRLTRSSDTRIRKEARGALIRELPKMVVKFVRRIVAR